MNDLEPSFKKYDYLIILPQNETIVVKLLDVIKIGAIYVTEDCVKFTISFKTYYKEIAIALCSKEIVNKKYIDFIKETHVILIDSITKLHTSKNILKYVK